MATDLEVRCTMAIVVLLVNWLWSFNFRGMKLEIIASKSDLLKMACHMN